MFRDLKPSLGVVNAGYHRFHPRYRAIRAHWVFNEGGGSTFFDISGYCSHGAGSGSTPVWTTGKCGQAVEFNGTNSAIAIGSPSALDDVRPLTVSLWAYPISGAEGGDQFIIGKSVGAGAWSFEQGGGGTDKLLFYVDLSTDMWSQAEAGSFEYSMCQHFVVTWDGTNQASGISWWKNGKQLGVASSQNGSTVTSDAALSVTIGERNPAYAYNGLLDDIRVYNRILTAREIVSLYMEPFLEFQPEHYDAVGAWFDLSGQMRRSSASRILQPYNLCEPFPGTP